VAGNLGIDVTTSRAIFISVILLIPFPIISLRWKTVFRGFGGGFGDLLKRRVFEEVLVWRLILGALCRWDWTLLLPC
jgi:hypothetical protein